MSSPDASRSFGSPELSLPDDLREPLHRHLDDLRRKFQDMDWGLRVGFGKTPALFDIDIDLADVMPVAEVTAKLVKLRDDTSRNRAG